MTDQQIQEYITNSLATQGAARAAFYNARMDYAIALGRGTATRQDRENVERLKLAYENT